jgi:hypothetical protein
MAKITHEKITQDAPVVSGQLIEAAVMGDKMKILVEDTGGGNHTFYLDLDHGNEILAACNGLGSCVVVRTVVEMELAPTDPPEV